MLPTTDPEIRAALHRKKLKFYRDAPDTIVVDELGLSHARARVDIAVINGCVHGFEIKSALDTLERLPSQLDLFTQCLGKLTLVCARRHIDQVEKIAPRWCGLVEATKGSRGAIAFATHRRGSVNPDLDAVQRAHLLWRSEATALLARYGASPKDLRRSRKQIYVDLAAHMTARELTSAIRESMLKRQAWRVRPAHA